MLTVARALELLRENDRYRFEDTITKEAGSEEAAGAVLWDVIAGEGTQPVAWTYDAIELLCAAPDSKRDPALGAQMLISADGLLADVQHLLRR